MPRVFRLTVWIFFLGLLCVRPLPAAEKRENPEKTAPAPAEATLPPLSPDIAAVLENVRAYYREAGDFQLAFQQDYHSRITRRAKKSEGQVRFAKPGKMRWDYEKPEKKSFISDGRELWMVTWDDKRAKVKKDLKASSLESSLGFLWGGGDLHGDYEIRRLKLAKLENQVEVGKRIALELVPRKPAQFDTLYLLLDPQSGRIEEALLVDKLENLNHLTFTDPKTRQNFDKNVFTFRAPDKTWNLETMEF